MNGVASVVEGVIGGGEGRQQRDRGKDLVLQSHFETAHGVSRNSEELPLNER